MSTDANTDNNRKVIDLTEVTEAHFAKTLDPENPYLTTLSCDDSELKTLVRSWRYAHLQKECGWEEGEILVIESGWLAGSRRSWAYVDTVLGGKQHSRSYVMRELYDCDYRERREETRRIVEAIIDLSNKKDVNIEFGHHTCFVEWHPSGESAFVDTRYSLTRWEDWEGERCCGEERGKGVTAYMEAWAETLSSVGRLLGRLKGMGRVVEGEDEREIAEAAWRWDARFELPRTKLLIEDED